MKKRETFAKEKERLTAFFVASFCLRRHRATISCCWKLTNKRRQGSTIIKKINCGFVKTCGIMVMHGFVFVFFVLVCQMSDQIMGYHTKIDRLPTCRYCFSVQASFGKRESSTEEKCFGMTDVLPHLFAFKMQSFTGVLGSRWLSVLHMHTFTDADLDVFFLAAIIVPLTCVALAALALVCFKRSVFFFLNYLIFYLCLPVTLISCICIQM